MCSKWAPGAEGTLIRGAKFSTAFLPWGRSYCCCDCCLQVRDSLGVVAIHPVLKVSPQIKIWGVQIRWMLWPLRVTPARCCCHANDSFEEWGVAPCCWNDWRTLTTPLRRPSAAQNLLGTWTYRSVLIVTDCSLWSSNQNGSMMPVCRWQPRQCTSQRVMAFADSAQGFATPDVVLRVHVTWQQKMCLVRKPDIIKKVWHSYVDRLLPKICLNCKYLSQ